MANAFDPGSVPTFSGLASESLEEYEWDVQAYVLGTKAEDRPLLGPRLARRLGGVPGALARRQLNFEALASENGYKIILEFLERGGYRRDSLDRKLLFQRRYETLTRGRNESLMEFFFRENMLIADMTKEGICPEANHRSHNMLTRSGLDQNQINLVYSHVISQRSASSDGLDPNIVQQTIIKFYDKPWDVLKRDAQRDRYLYARPVYDGTNGERGHHHHHRHHQNFFQEDEYHEEYEDYMDYDDMEGESVYFECDDDDDECDEEDYYDTEYYDTVLEQECLNDERLSEAYLGYREARDVLNQVRRGRGFWPVVAVPADELVLPPSRPTAKGNSKGSSSSARPSSSSARPSSARPSKGKSRGSSSPSRPPPSSSKGGGKGSRAQERARAARGGSSLKSKLASRTSCRKCGQTGHWEADCPLNTDNPAKRARTDGMRPPMAGQHFAWHQYPVKFAVEKTAAEAANSLEKWCDDVVVDAKNAEEKLTLMNVTTSMPEGTAIVDSGAAMCCIGETACARLAQSIEASGEPRDPITIDRQQVFRFGGADQTPVVANFAVSLPVHIAGHDTYLESFVVPGETPHLISRRWLSANQCTISFDPANMYLTSPHFKERIPLRLHESGHILMNIIRPEKNLKTTNSFYTTTEPIQNTKTYKLDDDEEVLPPPVPPDALDEWYVTPAKPTPARPRTTKVRKRKIDPPSPRPARPVKTKKSFFHQLMVVTIMYMTSLFACSCLEPFVAPVHEVHLNTSLPQQGLSQRDRRALMRARRNRLDYVEVWSGYPEGGRVVDAVRRRGGQALALGLGTGVDLLDNAVQKEILENLDIWKPKNILACPPCGPWGGWARFHLSHPGTPGYTTVMQRRHEHRQVPRFTAEILEQQVLRGGRVFLEHPWGSDFLRMGPMKRVIQKHKLYTVRVDQCMTGLKDRESGIPIRKATAIVTNDKSAARQLNSFRCDRNHDHQILEGTNRYGKRTKQSENYPKPLANILAKLIMVNPDPCHRQRPSENFVNDVDDKVVLFPVINLPAENVEARRAWEEQFPARMRIAVARLHTNLGHPMAATLAKMLSDAGASQDMVNCALRYQCSTCHNLIGPRLRRPASVPRTTTFNDIVYVDVNYLTIEQEQHLLYHIIDDATRFHQVDIIPNQLAETLISSIMNTWIRWAGPPRTIYCDPHPSQTSELFSERLGAEGVTVICGPAEAHWTRGVVERHGAYLRSMLVKMLADGVAYPDLQSLAAHCCWAKNLMSRIRGYSPSQWVLATQPRLPESMMIEDEADDAIPFKDIPEDDTSDFARTVRLRDSARRAFVQADTDMRLRRALSARSRPDRLIYQPGDRVFYWRARHGWSPQAAVVVSQVGVGHYYIDHGGRVFKVTAEQLRAVSEREHLAHEAAREGDDHRRQDPYDDSGAGPPRMEGDVIFGGSGPEVPVSPDVAEQRRQVEAELFGPESERDEPSPADPPDQDGDINMFPSDPPDAHHQGRPEDVPVPDADHLGPSEDDHQGLPVDTRLPGADPQGLHEDQGPPQVAQRPDADHQPEAPRWTPVLEPYPDGADLPIPPDPHDSDADEENLDADPLPQPAPSSMTSTPAPTLRRSVRIADREARRQQSQPYFIWSENEVVEIDLGFEAYKSHLDETTSHVAEVYAASSSTRGGKAGKAAAKRKAEVKLRDLSASDRALFDEAKRKEWQSWLSKSAVELVKNKLKVPRSQIMKARWVLTWKSEGKAKARLCVLGFQDPRLSTVETSSPTMTQDAEHLILQWLVNYGHLLQSGDLKTAFLSGDEDPNRTGEDSIYMEPPPDLRAWLKLGPNEVIRLRKAVYGLVDAPRRWHLRLSRALRQAGFVPLQTDECVWILSETLKTEQGSKDVAQTLRDRVNEVPTLSTTSDKHWQPRRVVHGILGVHVDDLIGGGDQLWEKAIRWLKSELEFGVWETRKFTFRGRELEQSSENKAITIKMTNYIDKIQPVSVPRALREHPEKQLDAELHSQYRGIVGGLQWLQAQGSPGLAYDVSMLQSKSASPSVADLCAANKLLRAAQTMKHTAVKIVSMPKRFVWMTLTDAAHANRPDLSSTSGHLILAAHPNILTGVSSPVSLLGWNSRKIRRKVRSSLGAESAAMSTGLEHTDLLRVMYGELSGDLIDLSEHENYLAQTESLVLSDCKSLNDALTSAGSAASKTSEDKRLGIEIAMIKQRMARMETKFQWVDAQYMCSDVLTKGLHRGRLDLLSALMSSARYKIKPTDEMLEKRKAARDRRTSASTSTS